MNNTKTIISSIVENDFSEVMSIANVAFGADYLDKSTLFEYQTDDQRIGLVSGMDDNIVGFALSRICDSNEIKALGLPDSDWLNQEFSKNSPIGMINSIAVHPNFQKKGIGSALIEQSIEKLSQVSSSLLSICWEHNNKVELGSILGSFGFKPICKIEQYWHNDSILKQYSCKFCGRPPCRCNAVLYVK